jgi:hypothetical protein
MKKLRLYSIVLLSFAIFACEKIVEFEDEVKDPKLTMNAIIVENELVVNLSESTTVLNSDPLPAIENGVVILYKNNQLFDILVAQQNGTSP